MGRAIQQYTSESSGFTKVLFQLVRIYFALFSPYELLIVMIFIKLVAFISWIDMNVKMPNVLVAVWLIMLAGRSARAFVRFPNGDGDFFDRAVDFAQRPFRDRVKVFLVLVWNNNHVPWVVDPPFWSDECRDVLGLINDVAILLVFGFVTRKPITKRT
jgi:hypothetical protein